LDREYKNWLDLETPEGKADLAKALIAIANHGGGYVILGYKDKAGNLKPDENRPVNLNKYSQENINGIIDSYADPTFHCTCYHVRHPNTGLSHPIIVVPGGHTVPIRTKRGGPSGQILKQNTIYTRRPGPSSDVPRTAWEWRELINRCVMNRKNEILNGKRSILEGAPTQDVEDQVDADLDEWVSDSLNRFNEVISERLPDEEPSRYSQGKWYVAYLIYGEFETPDLTQFRRMLYEVVGNETGWPVWLDRVPNNMPYSYDGTIECLIISKYFSDGAHSDYWRASPEGKMFLLRGYQEDVPNSPYEPGKELDVILPIWRIGECVLHSSRLAKTLSEKPLTIVFFACWEGLENRALFSGLAPLYGRHIGVCHTSTVKSKTTYRSDQIESNLPEIVNEILKPLYEAFDFYSLPRSTLLSELKKLQKKV